MKYAAAHVERAQRRLGETSLVLCAAAPFHGAVAISCGCRSRATAFLRSSGAPVTLRRGNDGLLQAQVTKTPGPSNPVGLIGKSETRFLEQPLHAVRKL